MENYQTPNNSEKKFKTIIGVLAGLCLVLAVLLIALLVKKTSLKEDIMGLTNDKEVLMTNVAQLQQDYAALSTTNDTINLQLAVEREKVAELIEKIKNTEATNSRKLRQYENELSSLRTAMRGYIRQIDSLNSLNIALKQENEQVKKNYEETSAKVAELENTNAEQQKQLDLGSVVKGRALTVMALNSSDKDTGRSRRARKLKSCFFLVENAIAKKGPMNVYLRVLGPDGILMTDGTQQTFSCDGEQLIYSAIREVDYQGEELQVCIYFAPGTDFTKGVYTVEAYTDKGKIGVAEIYLK